jgi:hypothetical protein
VCGIVESSQTFTSKAGAAVLYRSATTVAAAFWRYGAAFFSSVGLAVRRKDARVTYSTARNFFLHGSKAEEFNKMRQIRRGKEERGKIQAEKGLVPQRTAGVAGEDESKTPMKGKSGGACAGSADKMERVGVNKWVVSLSLDDTVLKKVTGVSPEPPHAHDAMPRVQIRNRPLYKPCEPSYKPKYVIEAV